MLQKVAAGDLTAHVQGNYQGDHARIKDDINVMADKLSGSMGQISNNAQTLAIFFRGAFRGQRANEFQRGRDFQPSQRGLGGK